MPTNDRNRRSEIQPSLLACGTNIPFLADDFCHDTVDQNFRGCPSLPIADCSCTDPRVIFVGEFPAALVVAPQETR